MSKELKPCPFCGGEVKIDSVDDDFCIVFAKNAKVLRVLELYLRTEQQAMQQKQKL